jgi:WD40 repeat protein
VKRWIFDWNTQSVTDESLKKPIVFKAHSDCVSSLSLNPASTKFCTGSWDKMIYIWSLYELGANTHLDLDEYTTKKKTKKNFVQFSKTKI